MELPYFYVIIAVVVANPAVQSGEEDPNSNVEPFEISPRVILRKRDRLWPHGIVPYSFAPGQHSEQDQANILQAMRAIEDVFKDHGFTDSSCQVKFVPRTNADKDYLEFYKNDLGPDACFSGIGRLGGNQSIFLGSNCVWHVGTITHELLHALGFEHQHNSPNRDNHVKIIEDNVLPNFTFAFKKLSEDEFTDGGVPYDAKSVMQYADNSFQINKDQPTIVSIDPNVEIPTTQARELSRGDWVKLHLLYCPTHIQVFPERDLYSVEYNSTEGTYWLNPKLT